MPFSVNRPLLLRRVLERISPGHRPTSRKGAPHGASHDTGTSGASGPEPVNVPCLNERLSDINETLSTVTETFVISCECADTSCVEMVDIKPDDYRGVRADARWFVVLPDHIYSEVESVIRRVDGYVVVEKFGAGGEVAKAADSTNDRQT